MKSRHPRPGRILARRVQEARKRRAWTQLELAEQVRALGYPMSRVVVTAIEKGAARADRCSISEVLALAAALGVAPVHLLDPHEYDRGDERGLAIGRGRGLEVPASTARLWLRGTALLPGGDMAAFLAAMPQQEREAVMKSYLETGLDSVGKALMSETTRKRVRALPEPKEKDDV